MAAIGSPSILSGAYTITYTPPGGSAGALGLFDGGPNGVPAIEITHLGKILQSTDSWGDTPIDGIFTGMSARFMGILEEYKAAVLLMACPWGAVGQLGSLIGKWMTDQAGSLVMTAVAGMSASASPATLTASKAIMAEGFNVKWLYAPILRQVPINLRLFPYVASANNVFWTQT